MKKSMSFRLARNLLTLTLLLTGSTLQALEEKPSKEEAVQMLQEIVGKTTIPSELLPKFLKKLPLKDAREILFREGPLDLIKPFLRTFENGEAILQAHYRIMKDKDTAMSKGARFASVPLGLLLAHFLHNRVRTEYDSGLGKRRVRGGLSPEKRSLAAATGTGLATYGMARFLEPRANKAFEETLAARIEADATPKNSPQKKASEQLYRKKLSRYRWLDALRDSVMLGGGTATAVPAYSQASTLGSYFNNKYGLYNKFKAEIDAKTFGRGRLPNRVPSIKSREEWSEIKRHQSGLTLKELLASTSADGTTPTITTGILSLPDGGLWPFTYDNQRMYGGIQRTLE